MNVTSKVVIGLGLVLAVGIGGYAWFKNASGSNAQSKVELTLQTYDNSIYGIFFRYPNEYELTEREVGDGHRWHYTITLTRTEDLSLPQNGEGPPTISFDIYQNDLDAMTLQQWLTSTNFSNFKLSNGTYASTTMSGAEAVRYHWSGLYEGNTVAFLHRDAVISISGMYLAPHDPIVVDFENILSSVRLY